MFYKVLQTTTSQGNFTAPGDLNLIIGRNTRIEILSVSPEGLRSLREFSINGSIEVITSIIVVDIMLKFMFSFRS